MSVYSLSIAYCATACKRGNFGQGNQRILLSFFFSPFPLDPKAVCAFNVSFRVDYLKEEADDSHPP